jgi:hypothetical protein
MEPNLILTNGKITRLDHVNPAATFQGALGCSSWAV